MALHPSFYLSIPLAVVYFFYPFYIIKAAPVWACAVASYLQKTRYGHTIAIGLMFGSFGDILLDMDDYYGVDLFIPGLVCFLIGHLCYIRAFYHLPLEPLAKYFAIPSLTAYYVIVMYFLLSTVSAFLIAPIIIYAFAIVTMVLFAFNRFVRQKEVAVVTRYCALIGSLYFITSDTLLSFNTFYTDIYASDILIMVTYYLGQMFIAASTQFSLDNDIDYFEGDVDLQESDADCFQSNNPLC